MKKWSTFWCHLCCISAVPLTQKSVQKKCELCYFTFYVCFALHVRLYYFKKKVRTGCPESEWDHHVCLLVLDSNIRCWLCEAAIADLMRQAELPWLLSHRPLKCKVFHWSQFSHSTKNQILKWYDIIWCLCMFGSALHIPEEKAISIGTVIAELCSLEENEDTICRADSNINWLQKDRTLAHHFMERWCERHTQYISQVQ